MARKTNGLFAGELTTIREATTQIAVDNASLTDANYPLLQAVDCAGYESIFVGVEITGGTSPTMTVEALFRDDEAADGARWKRISLGALPGVTLGAAADPTSGALLPNGSLGELRVFGWKKVFLRISAVANATSTTAWKILAAPGRIRSARR